jgi:hypothetical protein
MPKSPNPKLCVCHHLQPVSACSSVAASDKQHTTRSQCAGRATRAADGQRPGRSNTRPAVRGTHSTRACIDVL